MVMTLISPMYCYRIAVQLTNWPVLPEYLDGRPEGYSFICNMSWASTPDSAHLYSSKNTADVLPHAFIGHGPIGGSLGSSPLEAYIAKESSLRDCARWLLTLKERSSVSCIVFNRVWCLVSPRPITRKGGTDWVADDTTMQLIVLAYMVPIELVTWRKILIENRYLIS